MDERQKSRKKRGDWMKQRSILGRVAVPLLIYYGISLVITMFASAIVAGLKMPQYLNGQVEYAQMVTEMTNEILKYTTIITGVTALVAIPIFWWMFHKDNRIRRQMGMAEPAKASPVKYVWIVILGVAACVALNNILTLSNLAMISSYEETGANFYKVNIVAQIICLGILTPIAEELTFRGLIFKRLREVMNMKRAILISALIFGIYHGNLVQAVYGGVLGALLSYAYEKYGSIKAPILAHMVLNLTSVILSEIGGFSWMFEQPMRMGIATVACAAISATMYVMIQRIGQGEADPRSEEQ